MGLTQTLPAGRQGSGKKGCSVNVSKPFHMPPEGSAYPATHQPSLKDFAGETPGDM
jgi:hypothetical protein